MQPKEIFVLGFGLTQAWKLIDQRLWRIVNFYVQQAMQNIDLSSLEAFGLDETASRRGHNYVTVFIDLERSTKPVIFATPGKGEPTVQEFKENMVVTPTTLPELSATCPRLSWPLPRKPFLFLMPPLTGFHVVQLFTKAIDEVRRTESKEHSLFNATRWAVLKASDKTIARSTPSWSSRFGPACVPPRRGASARCCDGLTEPKASGAQSGGWVALSIMPKNSLSRT